MKSAGRHRSCVIDNAVPFELKAVFAFAAMGDLRTYGDKVSARFGADNLRIRS